MRKGKISNPFFYFWHYAGHIDESVGEAKCSSLIVIKFKTKNTTNKICKDTIKEFNQSV